MGTSQTRLTLAFAITITLAGIAVLAVVGSPDRWNDVALAGICVGALVLCWLSSMRAINRTSRRSADAYDEGYEAGYDKGWCEGRRRPVLRSIKQRRGDGDAVDGTAS